MDDPCDGAEGNACALALDRDLPSTINDPRIKKLFKERTGTDMEAFGQKVGEKGMSMAQVASRLAGAKDAATEKKVKDFFERYEKGLAKRIDGTVSLASYFGGGKARVSRAKDGKNSFFKRDLDSISGNAKTKETAFEKMIGMNAEQIATDRSISLFTRVEYRHQKVKNRLEDLPYLSIYNRATVNGAVIE